jgi:hypothetical protein
LDTSSINQLGLGGRAGGGAGKDPFAQSGRFEI